MRKTIERPYDRQLASIIDHTVMRPDLTKKELEEQCNLVRQYGFAGICVNTVHIPIAARILQDSAVRICTDVGFPLGASSYLMKAMETRDAVAGGADEVDIGDLLPEPFRDHRGVQNRLKNEFCP